MKKILLADDHFVVRAGVSMIIEKTYPHFLVHQAEDYQETLKKIENESYDILFLDINMPGTKYELMVNEVKSITPDLKIIIFSVYEENIAIKYLTEGANGYLNKLSSMEKIIEAVDSVLREGYYYSPQIMKQMFLINQKRKKINPFDNLTEKEKEIAYLLIEGNGNLEISNLLKIQMSTVSTYKKKIFKKVNVKNIIELYSLFEQASNNLL